MTSILCRPSLRPRALTQASVSLLALTVGGLALAGCGAKGPILPPISLVPQATTDLAVRQQGNEIVLSASYPKTTISGVAMPGIESIEIYRYVRPLPPAVPPAAGATTPAAADAGAAAVSAPPVATTPPADSASAPAAAPSTPPAAAPSTAPPATAAAAIATSTAAATPTVPAAPDPREFALAAEKLLTLRGSELASVVTGETLEMRVPLPQPPPADRQAWTLAIRVVAKGDFRSELSNQVTLAPVPAPTAPSGLTVQAKENGIEVSWTAIDPSLLGVLIYRREAQSPNWGEFIHGTPIADGTTYLDTTAQYGHRYVYSISACASLAPRIESSLGGEQEVDYQDRFAPAAPSHLLALSEARRVRLVWERSPATDVAGYVVFRQDPGGEFHRLNPEPTAALEWSDTGLVPRVEYHYRVAAIDKSGNLGEPGEIAVGSPSGQR